MIMPTTKDLLKEAWSTMTGNKFQTAITGLSALVSICILSAVCLTLMSWGCVEQPVKPLTLEYDNRLVKESIQTNQARAMAEATAVYNRHMDTIAKGKK